MKRMGFGLSLSLAALSLLASAALAESPHQAIRALSAADQAFLASLVAPARTPATAPVARHPRTGPRTGSRTGLEKALCNASATCNDGSTVSCEGNSSCSAVDSQCPWGEGGHVTCDGVTTSCPACPFNCSQAEDECSRWCYPCPYSFSCDESGPSCDCNWSVCQP
jgi:hypothetical protein